MLNAREHFGFPPLEKANDFRFRDVVFGVIFDYENNMGVYVVNEDPYVLGLSGGGVENKETQEEGLRRECFEELGVAVKIIEKLFDYEAVFSIKKGYKGSFFICKLVGGKNKQKVFREDGSERIVQ